MKKVSKACLSWLLTICLLITPFSGVFVFATDGDPGPGPLIDISVSPYDAVLADTEITVSYSANGTTTVASCDTRLEGVSLGTTETVTFTPEEQGLQNGRYTLIAEAVGSNGVTSYDVVTFVVCDDMDISFSYAEDESIVPDINGATATVYEVEPLEYSMGYGTTSNNDTTPGDALVYDEATVDQMKYWNIPVTLDSMSGIPYQTFDVALNGKTAGDVVVR